MTVLNNKNHKQWKQAQARISVSPLANRISGEGCSCGPRFWRKCLSQKTTHANPGASKTMDRTTASVNVKSCEGRRRRRVKIEMRPFLAQ